MIIENLHICFRLVKNFSNFWQPIFMTLFPWSMVNVCGTSLMIQIEIVSYFCLFFKLNLKFDYNFKNIVSFHFNLFRHAVQYKLRCWRWQWPMYSMHSEWFSLFVSFAKELQMNLRIFAIRLSTNFIGIYFQTNWSGFYPQLLLFHSNQLESIALEAWNVLATHLNELVSFNVIPTVQNMFRQFFLNRFLMSIFIWI